MTTNTLTTTTSGTPRFFINEKVKSIFEEICNLDDFQRIELAAHIELSEFSRLFSTTKK